MTNIKCIIVDDEPDAAELLRLCLIDIYPHLNIAGVYYNWKNAFTALTNDPVDILFTDISMPEKNSIDLLKLLPSVSCEIIFTTAHTEYALNAYQFAPAGYLLKPIVDAELTVAVNKAIERVKYKKLTNNHMQDASNNKIGIFNNKGIDYIPMNSIIYLESSNKCTKVITAQNEYTSSYHLGKFKPMLSENFYQVHRSYIINLGEIVRYETTGIAIMSNKKNIPIARNIRDGFMKSFSIFNLPGA